jgi:hypothetical protein
LSALVVVVVVVMGAAVLDYSQKIVLLELDHHRFLLRVKDADGVDYWDTLC